MREIINIVVGIFALIKIGTHFYSCAMCEELLFGFQVSWIIYIGFWALIAVFSFQRYFQMKKQSTP